MSVLNTRGNIEVYAPAFGQPADQYAVTQTTAANTMSTRVTVGRTGLTVCPRAPRSSTSKQSGCFEGRAIPIDYIVRVPKQARVSLFTADGSIHVTDVFGPVEARVRQGDIKIQIPSYADAATQYGNVTVMFGDAHWPGTLHFSAERGDVEVWVPATADARVDLHADHGTIFTDFDLRGSSSHGSETIVGSIGHGGTHAIDVRVTNGSIRLLKLTPQM